MKCGRCGSQHPPTRCPAWGKSRLKCGGRNHFAEMCRTKSVKQLVQGDNRDDDQFFLDTLFIGNIEKADEWHAVIRCNETPLKVKLDTGVANNVMPLGTFRKITPRPQIKQSNTMLRAYGGQRVTHVGKCQLECSVNGRYKQCDFYIVNLESPPILALSMCENLGLITRGVKGVEAVPTESINSTYKDVCNGLGCFEELYHIVVEQDTVPVKELHRRVPFGLQYRLKLKLDLMENRKVIQKVNKPTYWVHKLVIVEKKDGFLRLCLDRRELNKTFKRENFQIPTVEDVTCRLSGKKVFTVIDLKDAFWQVHLSEENASLTTFNTPFGRYFFKRMPFGLCSASEVCTKHLVT